MPRALITGITGQDGSYLAESLLNDGFEVHGIIRRHSTFGTKRIDRIFDSLKLYYGDVTDLASVCQAIEKAKPDYIYHLAAQSHVWVSFEQPVYTTQTIVNGTLNLLEALRILKVRPKVYVASSSEMFGRTVPPQSELSKFDPQSPYAVAKLAAHNLADVYRKAHDMDIRCGILFNHESPRRGENFVTRKITRGLASIVAGSKERIALGNLFANRDWGYAKEFVEAMRLITERDNPRKDYVIGTGSGNTVEAFLHEAFSMVGLTWQDHVRLDERLHRPLEVPNLLADTAASRTELGWAPETRFRDLVRMMVDADLNAVGFKRCEECRKAVEKVSFPMHQLSHKGSPTLR